MVVLTTGTPMACASANTIPKPSLSPFAAVTTWGRKRPLPICKASRTTDRWLGTAKLAADTQFSCECLQRLAQRAVADNSEFALRVRPLHRLHGTQQVLAPFLLHKSSHKENTLRCLRRCRGQRRHHDRFRCNEREAFASGKPASSARSRMNFETQMNSEASSARRR